MACVGDRISINPNIDQVNKILSANLPSERRMTPGDRLKELRSTLKLTTRAVSEALGVSNSVYSDWETGKAPVRQPNAMALQLLYGVSWEWLLTGEGPMWIESKPAPVPPRPQFPPSHIVELPVFEGPPAFLADGETLRTGPSTEWLPFHRGVLDPMLRRAGAGTLDTLCLIRIPDDDAMRPLLVPGGLALVNTALGLRQAPVDGGLYLIRVEGEIRFRRLFPQDPKIFPGVTAATENPGVRIVPVPLTPEAFPGFIVGMVSL